MAGRGSGMLIDDFAGGVFAGAATAGHRQICLNFAEGFGTPIHDLADLTIANGSADANVHRPPIQDAARLIGNENDCQLAKFLDVT